MVKKMTLAERMAISYSHIDDEFDEAFIKRLHRTQGSTRLLVRNPSANGQPYGCHGIAVFMKMRNETYEYTLAKAKREAKEIGCSHYVKVLQYWNKHWRYAEA